RLEVEPGAFAVGDDDLPVNHAPLRQLLDDLGDQFGKVPRHRPLVTAADLHLVAVAEDDGPESVPLRLVAIRAVGYLLDRLGEHPGDRRGERKSHGPISPFRWRTCPHPALPSSGAAAQAGRAQRRDEARLARGAAPGPRSGRGPGSPARPPATIHA